MKNLNQTILWIIFFTIFLIFSIWSFSYADDSIIFDSGYGGNKVGRVDGNGVIWDRHEGGRKIGRVEDNGTVYDDFQGGKKVGRINGNGKLYDSFQGGKIVGEHDGETGRVYDDSHRAIGQVDDKRGSGYFLLDGE